jgi:3-isopropylmalate/(R)-2-methylmalate dehydratase large subunit
VTAHTISEKILSAHCGRQVRAGEIVVCRIDCVMGTDGSGPMAIDYFEQMGGRSLFDPSRVFFSLDHYAPPDTPQTRAFHQRIRAFAASHGAMVFEVGDGISHQVAVDRGLVRAGDLVVGADSHTVTCGALNAFAIGVGSSDLAAAMLTGKIWLRVPETIRVALRGRRLGGVAAKDVALFLIKRVGGDAANYQAIEFAGDALPAFTMDDRLVLCNLMVEAGAKAAMFPGPIASDPEAAFRRDVDCDLGDVTPQVARPHAPDNVVPLRAAAGIPVQMVFIGTCTGGRAVDFREAWAAFTRAGGRLAAGVQLVLTPASRDVHDEIVTDGTLERFLAAGAILTTTGCGACCGTSGVIPGDGMTVLSTANRNFKARMGNATAEIYLASPAVCGAAAATGRIPEQV